VGDHAREARHRVADGLDLADHRVLGAVLEATTANIEKLKSYGNHIVEPVSGELASGLEGKGRMAEPEEILKEVIRLLSKKKSLT
ncbi:MAG: hypothetical protein R6W67_03535, partial [Bacteroidales bacterium]